MAKKTQAAVAKLAAEVQDVQDALEELQAVEAEAPKAKSGIVAALQAAPVHSKILMLSDGLYLATPDGATKVQADDPAAKLFPEGTVLRKMGPDAFEGFLPHGAAQSIREVRVSAPDAAAVAAALVAAITQ